MRAAASGDLGRVGEASLPHVPVGELAARRAHHVKAPGAQRGEVLLDRRPFPHPGVHGRGEQDRAGAGERGRGDRVVPHSGAQPREEIGGGRRHDEEVGAPGQLQVAVGGLGGWVEQVHQHRVAGEGLEGERADEAGGVRRHDHADVRAPLHEEADDLAGLVGGDAAAHAEDHGTVAKGAHLGSFTIMFRNVDISHTDTRAPRRAPPLAPGRRAASRSSCCSWRSTWGWAGRPSPSTPSPA